MVEEIAVFGGQHGVAQQRGNLALVQHEATLAGIGGEGHLRFAIEYLRDELRTEAGQGVDPWHVNGSGDGDSHSAPEDDRGEELHQPAALAR